MRPIVRILALASLAVAAACEGSSTPGEPLQPPPPSPSRWIAVHDTMREAHWTIRPDHGSIGLEFRLVDVHGNPVIGEAATFTLTGTGGVIDGTSGTTGSEGRAYTGFLPTNMDGSAVVEVSGAGAAPARYRIAVRKTRLEITPEQATLVAPDCGVYLMANMGTAEESLNLQVDFRSQDTTVARVYEPNMAGTYRGRRVVAVATQRAGTVRVIGTVGLETDTTTVEVPPACIAAED